MSEQRFECCTRVGAVCSMYICRYNDIVIVESVSHYFMYIVVNIKHCTYSVFVVMVLTLRTYIIETMLQDFK